MRINLFWIPVFLQFLHHQLYAQVEANTVVNKIYSCIPCGRDCDKEVYQEPGTCKICRMAIVERKAEAADSLSISQKSKEVFSHNKFNAGLGKVNKLTKQTISQIDELFAAYSTSNSPGYAIGIFSNGKVLYKKGYGMANLDYNIPLSAESVFNIASLSKQFTAASIALLILRDSISLEDDVKQYIPEVGKYQYPIKIKHLAYMTSGIPEYHSLPHKNGLNWNLYDYFTVDTAVAVSLNEPALQYEPGTQWTYSNINYMLLAKIVEKVSGKTFAQFAEENIFEPLGMKNTHFNDDVTLVVKNRATGYIPVTPQLVEETKKAGYYFRSREGYAQIHRNSPHYGGSGLFTSINDWYLWNQNFYTMQLGGKGFYDLMHKRMKFTHTKDNDAFGLVFGSFKGEEIIWYAGGDIGFNSYVMRFPAQELTIVCFSNVNSSGGAESYAHKVGELILQQTAQAKSKK